MIRAVLRAAVRAVAGGPVQAAALSRPDWVNAEPWNNNAAWSAQ